MLHIHYALSSHSWNVMQNNHKNNCNFSHWIRNNDNRTFFFPLSLFYPVPVFYVLILYWFIAKVWEGCFNPLPKILNWQLWLWSLYKTDLGLSIYGEWVHLVDISAIFRKVAFVTFCYFFCTSSPFRNRLHFERKEFVPQKQFFHPLWGTSNKTPWHTFEGEIRKKIIPLSSILLFIW